MTSATVVTSLLLFLLAGFCEIGGGWLVWQWIREGRPWFWGLLGRAGALSSWCGPYAATCSLRSRLCSLRRFFIVLSLLWGCLVDRNIPDRFDIVGAIVSLVGVTIIMYWPR